MLNRSVQQAKGNILSQSQAIIIDDNNKNVLVLSQLLSDEGIESIRVTDPTKLDTALQRASEVRVVFLDLEMPDIDGYEVLEKLKADSRFQSIPVVAYTVHVSEIRVAHDRGFDGFLGKPLDADKFPKQLSRILNGDSVWEIS
jgi:two-component system, cell cycle response regulator DivK